MNRNAFSAGELFKIGWTKAKRFLVYFFCLFLLIFAINVFLSIFRNRLGLSNNGLFIFNALSCLIDLVVGLGLTKVTLDICDEKIPNAASFFSSIDFFLNYSVGFILFSLMTTLGMLLFIVPGIVLLLKFQFFAFFIIDKKLGPIEALKESSRITQGIKLELLGFAILMGLINILGALAFGVGLIASISTTLIAHAALYRKLTSNS
ncbi:MAG: hypothetical protein KAS13_07630 [Candidatus Omnitrophica bacterium]|nr:hypothetical protein [Candidatus Omnitrophota bacterium]